MWKDMNDVKDIAKVSRILKILKSDQPYKNKSSISSIEVDCLTFASLASPNIPNSTITLPGYPGLFYIRSGGLEENLEK